jgi:hypothetical protein
MLMDSKNLYIQKMEEQLKILDAELRKLSAKGGLVQAEAKAAIETQLKPLQATHQGVASRLAELRGESGKAWNEVHDSLERAWEELRDSVDCALTTFNQQKG